MAPEQIEGHPRVASDQYALAVVAYEWLCGEQPFEGSVTEIIVKHLSMPPPPLRERVPTISPEVEQVVLRALAKDSKERFASVATFAVALEQASLPGPSQAVQPPKEQLAPGSSAAPSYATFAVLLKQPIGATEATTPVEQLPGELTTPQSQEGDEMPLPGQFVAPRAAVTPLPVEVPLLPKPTIAVQRRSVSRTSTVLLIGLVVVVIAGVILGGTSLLARLGVHGTGNGPTTSSAVRGGIWTDEFFGLDIDSLIPNDGSGLSLLVDQALYLPLFYGDAQGEIHPGAAAELPTVQNGGISADLKAWTFHMRPNLVWSDGQPYDARDVDFTWKLWLNPKFPANSTIGLNLITSADISADDLSITFHLKQPYSPYMLIFFQTLSTKGWQVDPAR